MMDTNELYEALRRAVWNYAANPTEQNVDACEALSTKLEAAVKVRKQELFDAIEIEMNPEVLVGLMAESEAFITKFWEFI